MKIATTTPLYELLTPEGPTHISHPCPGDLLAVREASNHVMLAQPIIGWARDLDGQLSLYTAGPDSSLFRLALEEGCAEELFFAGRVPDSLREYRLDEYAQGALLYYPVPVVQPAIMHVSYTLQVAA